MNSPHSKKKCECIIRESIRIDKGICPVHDTPQQKQEVNIPADMNKTASIKSSYVKKQESGGWEERLQQIFLKPWTSEKIKSFISKELQEAERRGYRRIRKWTNGRNVTKDSLRAELKKLLKKVC